MTSTRFSPSNTLTATSLRCVRGERTLFDDLNFSVTSGQCLHVIGANGSGKTSLLRILCGVRLTDHGCVAYNGNDTHRNRHFYAACAYIGHKDGLKNELTAIENLRCYQRLAGINDEDALDDCLHKMGILRCADLDAQQLSFGQRRRLAFARLLLTNHAMWILDEPFTGIDIAGRELIESLCVEHLENAGIIIMTHHQSLDSSPINPYRTELRLD